MTIAVYKSGVTHTVRGIECEVHRLPNSKLEWALANGYYLAPESITGSVTVDEINDDVSEDDDPAKPYAGMNEAELRLYAKEIGIKSAHNKKPDTLLDEIHALLADEDD